MKTCFIENTVVTSNDELLEINLRSTLPPELRWCKYYPNMNSVRSSYYANNIEAEKFKLLLRTKHADKVWGLGGDQEYELIVNSLMYRLHKEGSESDLYIRKHLAEYLDVIVYCYEGENDSYRRREPFRIIKGFEDVPFENRNFISPNEFWTKIDTI